MKEVVQEFANANNLTRDTDLREYLNRVFQHVSNEYGLAGADFQRRASKIGKAFEEICEMFLNNLYPDLILRSSVPIPQACMEGGGSADFVVYAHNNFNPPIIAVIEAKGSADTITDDDGNSYTFPRPGMMRTDTVKKAISNAYQVKRSMDDVIFFIITSHKPIGGNAKCMCDLAEGDIVDRIVDITNINELDEMIAMINDKIGN